MQNNQKKRGRVITAKKESNIFDGDKPLRFSIYHPVSTDKTPQISSLELQRMNYAGLLKGEPEVLNEAEGE